MFQFLGKWIETSLPNGWSNYGTKQAKNSAVAHCDNTALSGKLKLKARVRCLAGSLAQNGRSFGHLALVAPLQTTADLDSMSNEQWKFLKTKKLAESSKAEIRKTKHKTDRYMEMNFWLRSDEVHTVIADFHDFAAQEALLPPGIGAKFERVAEGLWHAIADKRTGQAHEIYKLQTRAWTKVKEELEPLVKAIKVDIQERLYGHGGKL
jgi:hypothetical protein